MNKDAVLKLLRSYGINVITATWPAILGGLHQLVGAVPTLGLPWYVSLPLSALLGAIVTYGTRVAHVELAPTPNLSVDDTGPALGKASGEAGAAAGKGPFTR